MKFTRTYIIYMQKGVYMVSGITIRYEEKLVVRKCSIT